MLFQVLIDLLLELGVLLFALRRRYPRCLTLRIYFSVSSNPSGRMDEVRIRTYWFNS